MNKKVTISADNKKAIDRFNKMNDERKKRDEDAGKRLEEKIKSFGADFYYKYGDIMSKLANE